MTHNIFKKLAIQTCRQTFKHEKRHLSKINTHDERIQQEFTTSAKLFSDAMSKRATRLLSPLLKACDVSQLKNPKPTIVDVACGPGLTTIGVSKLNKYGKTIGLDITNEMLRVARNNAEKEQQALGNGEKLHIEFRTGNVEHLPFEPDSVDMVVSRLAFHHFVSPKKVMSEIFRVLKRTGTAVIMDIVTANDDKAKYSHYKTSSKECTRLYELCNAIEKLRDPSHHGFLWESDMLHLFESTGFERVETTDKFEDARTVRQWIEQTGSYDQRRGVEVLLRELLEHKVDTGMQLHLNDQHELMFVHRYVVWRAHKP
ncbi:methyltransferase type 11 [Reticulomyxa filosa]|uniref:Methyltransferase type 11 n=1 Tax=Reticulomyxa filosa TaxID=46433 RepID=X6N1L9_RETFI|nr:methyltransferase type 11 [Reticulomyxa filosa]|eukprot:ETO19941.1 methyltransferase type 11 [Reticulomyxa filosa]